jgi:SAM-dependent methyltransferase
MKLEHWNRHYAEREAPASAEAHVRLESEVAGLVPGRALDLACGAGRNAVWLAARGWRVTAVDFSETALASASALAARSGAAVEWVAADLLDYRPATHAYDLVLMFFLHLPPDERDAVIDAAAQAVAPGGTFLLAAHHRRNLAEGVRGPKDPELLYDPEDVVARLAGFEIVRAACIVRPLETPAGEGRMVDTLVRARRPREGEPALAP